MSKNTLLLKICRVLLPVLLVTGSAAHSATPYVINYTTYKFENSWFSELNREFIANLEQRSKNRLKVNLQIQSNHLNYPDFVAQVETGDMDMALVSYEGLYAYSPKFQALYAPYLFDSYDLAHHVIDNYIHSWLNEELIHSNIFVFSIFDLGFRQFTTRDIDVSTVKDLKDVSIASSSLPGLMEAISSFGAVPHEIDFTQIYANLKNKEIVGQEQTLSVIEALKLYEVQNRLILTNHVFMTMPLIINKRFLDALPADLQEILHEEVLKAQQKNRDRIAREELAFIEKLQSQGMTVQRPKIDSFVSAVDKAYDALQKIVGEQDMISLLFEINSARYEMMRKKEQKTDDSVLEDDFEDE
ncbi:MAG: TRAP transporter substrate-binding protein [Succinivibrio sp.]|nr:TRAP transporter substrate-binding protein [Succinivibrio sp.]